MHYNLWKGIWLCAVPLQVCCYWTMQRNTYQLRVACKNQSIDVDALAIPEFCVDTQKQECYDFLPASGLHRRQGLRQVPTFEQSGIGKFFQTISWNWCLAGKEEVQTYSNYLLCIYSATCHISEFPALSEKKANADIGCGKDETEYVFWNLLLIRWKRTCLPKTRFPPSKHLRIPPRKTLKVYKTEQAALDVEVSQIAGPMTRPLSESNTNAFGLQRTASQSSKGDQQAQAQQSAAGTSKIDH